MNKNDTAIVTIEDIGVHGEGIGKVDGYTLFVKDAVIGDVVEAKVMKAKKHYGYARLLRVVTPSAHRVEPVCAVATQCGGCQLQAMDYKEQLHYKDRKVKDHLVRLGGFDRAYVEQIAEPVCGMEEPWHYRNKAQFPIGKDQKGRPVAGFYAGRSHRIIPCLDCAIGARMNQKILLMILKYMEECQVEPYNEETGKGLLRHVLIRSGFATGEWMVCLVINGRKKGTSQWLPQQEKIIEALEGIPGMVSICVSSNTKNTNVIMGDTYEVLAGRGYLEDSIGEVTYRISPLSFYQINPEQTRKLYEKALEYADLTGEETVWDLYCGIGTISLFLARKVRRVYGVEVVPQAIRDARENARINGITNAEFFTGKAEEVVPQWQQDRQPDVVVVDPPRKGCDETLLETILAAAPKRIVYVSCDSATLARDLKILCQEKYELQKFQVVDQFAQTVHTECVALLSMRGEVTSDSLLVNGKEYRILTLLGKGKGGYSYLVSDGRSQFVLKQIHHEPCSYYHFGNKIQSEINDYRRLKKIGIRIPEMIDVDIENERILKEYIEGNPVSEIVESGGMKSEYIEQVKEMCSLLYPANTNIDYYPTNFVVQNGLIYYIDFECNDYMEEWDFENWGIKYWTGTAGGKP